MTDSDLRVVIAEDSALIREGIARLIEESGGTVVAKVGDGDAFVEAVVDASTGRLGRRRPDAADASATRAFGPRSRPGGACPARPILVLSQYVERQYATELLADGAGGVGYLLKDRVGDIPRVHGRAPPRRSRRNGARSGGRRPADGPQPRRRSAVRP